MIISALNDYYNHLLERGDSIAIFGYSQEQISYALVLSVGGELVDVQDLRDTSGNKPRPRSLMVPQPEKRTSGVKSNFLWDKSSYVLGVASKGGERATQEHNAFKELHGELLKNELDTSLQAVRIFLEQWVPEQFTASGLFNAEMLDARFVFRIDGEKAFVHESPAAKKIRAEMVKIAAGDVAQCLVTGNQQPISRLHPAIKGVDGAQSSGASIVCFNLDAFCSFQKSQGNNAPVSEQVAFAYTTALNHLLRREEGNRQRLRIGDTTVVFWAKAQNVKEAEAAEMLFGDFLQPPAETDVSETSRLRSALDAIAKGRPLNKLNPELAPDTEIFVLGLAPNASRLSVRFWERGNLEVFAKRLAQHYQDLNLVPSPWKTEPAVWRLLRETVPHRDGVKPKLDDVQPLIAGEMTRSILTGKRYPRSLLTNLIMRMRADGDISPLRVAMCKGVLARDWRLGVRGIETEVPVSLDTENNDPGYLLGRLFATLESVQRSAQGRDVNATIRDRYYGAASATPASVFPVLIRNAQNHLGKIRKGKPGLAVNLQKQLGEILDRLASSFPRSLRIEAQGRFAIGYYHQTQAHYTKAEANAEEGEE
ncbi:type I-C CRISPR-associated protein Cas8c/Csd1 [Marinobacter sp. F4216]|uniref:type I-C CRISPR-associated protein Cas8c/Csd1 n=1 Tax=Marinobacter sp. F4216 TaxID=2874281 RepID=UPI001CBBDA38|nr:type I-C CRISPR-associated protein Cas8c/Csd1 [Marinobacter sp. F4216]MBZ2168905.1 type I-C CRISPR-associated protein Cas8c/Csd1 [Marinobacter sp. F4216]